MTKLSLELTGLLHRKNYPNTVCFVYKQNETKRCAGRDLEHVGDGDCVLVGGMQARTFFRTRVRGVPLCPYIYIYAPFADEYVTETVLNV